MDCFYKLIPFTFFLFFSFPAYSAYTASGSYMASKFKTTYRAPASTASRLLFDATFKGVDSKGLSVYVAKKVPISKTVLGKIAMKRAFTPQGLALMAAMEGIGWLTDYLTEQMYKEESITDDSSGVCSSMGQVSSYSECIAYAESNGYGSFLYSQVNANFQIYNYHDSGLDLFSPTDSTSMEESQAIADGYSPGSSTGLEYATAEDYEKSITSLTDDEIEDLFTHPTSQLPDSNTNPDDSPFPETESSPSMDEDPFRNVARYLNQYFLYASDGDPLTDPDAIPDPTNPINNTPPSYSEGSSFDLCLEYPTILACQQMGTPDDPIEIGAEEIPFDYSPVALSGSASCPDPFVFTLSNGNDYSINNQPVCDFATGINGVVIIVCSMIGIYIISGGIRNG